MAVVKQVFDDGSVMLTDEAGNPLGSFDTGGQYVPYQSAVGQNLASNLLGTTVNRVLDALIGSQTVNAQAAGMRAPTPAPSMNTSILGMIALGLGAAVLLSLVLNPRK